MNIFKEENVYFLILQIKLRLTSLEIDVNTKFYMINNILVGSMYYLYFTNINLLYFHKIHLYKRISIFINI